MDYLTKFYKNRCEILQQKLNHLENLYESFMQVPTQRYTEVPQEQRAKRESEIGLMTGAEFEPGEGPSEDALGWGKQTGLDAAFLLGHMPRFGAEKGKLATAPRIVPPVSGAPIRIQTPFEVIPGEKGVPGSFSGKIGTIFKDIPTGAGFIRGANEWINTSSGNAAADRVKKELENIAAAETHNVAYGHSNLNSNQTTKAVNAANKAAERKVARANSTMRGAVVSGILPGLVAGTHGYNMTKDILAGNLPTLTDTTMTGAGTAALVKPLSRILPRLFSKEVTRLASRAAPLLTFATGLAFGAERAKAGDKVGAGAEVGTGIVANAGPVGAIGSFATDPAFMYKDYIEMTHPAPNPVDLPPGSVRTTSPNSNIETKQGELGRYQSYAAPTDIENAMNPSGAFTPTAARNQLQAKRKAEQEEEERLKIEKTKAVMGS